MMTLLWKVGNTYHLCGEGAEQSSYASLAGDYLRLFLPVVDITGGPRFVTRNGILPESLQPVPGAEPDGAGNPDRRETVAAADEEPPAG